MFLGSTPIGGQFIGWISQQWGARSGLFVGGALSLMAALAAAWALRRERAAEAEPADEELVFAA